MIAEIGHYALVLALGLALIQARGAADRRALRDETLMAVAGPTALGAVRLRRDCRLRR